MPLENSGYPTPKSGSARTPQDIELYRHISQEDAVMPVVKKDEKSPLIEFMAKVMRVALYFDSVKHTHELLFRRLNALWGFLMAILYISGILMLLFSIYNRVQFPSYMEQQMKTQGIQFESATYDMDHIEMHNLKGPDGLYSVDTLIARTTLVDLLQKRIRSVVLDGVNVYLNTSSDFNPIQDIPTILTQLQNPLKGETDLTIGALTVNNAKLKFQDSQVALPLSFSLEGVYDRKTKIMIPLSMNQPFLKFKGVLSVSDTAKNPTWVLNISSGNITLPRSAPEDFTGEIKLTLANQKLETLDAAFHLKTGTIQKEITANFKPKDEKGLTGTLSWARNHETESNLSSNMSMDFSYLTFSSKEPLRTSGTITIRSTQFNLNGISFTSLHQPMDADIICHTWKECTFNLKKETTVKLSNFQLEYNQQKFKAADALHFTIPATNDLCLMDAEKSDFSLTFNVPLTDVIFESDDETSSVPVDLTSKSFQLTGVWADEPRLTIQAQGLNYTSDTASLKQGILNIADLLQDTTPITLQAQEMLLFDTPVLSQPFQLNFKMVGTQAAAQLKFKSLPFLANLEGQFSLQKHTFVGQINVAPFDLKNISIPLNTLWPNIPNSIQNASGKVAIRGQLSWNNGRAVGTPLYLGLKDVSFNLGNTKIQGLNTVITMESLSPLTTKSNQHLFIKQVNALVPFTNLDMQFQLEDQSVKINQLLAFIGNMSVGLPPSAITPKNGVLTLDLKNNQNINLSSAQESVQLEGIQVNSGTASIAIPVNISANAVAIPNITMRLQDTQLTRKGTEFQDIFGTESGYFVRNGLITLNENRTVQLTWTGRLLPSKKTKEIQLNNLIVPAHFIKAASSGETPADIQNRQKFLFSE